MLISELQSALAAAERFFRLLSEDSEVADVPGAAELENIAYGKENATMEEVVHAAKAAKIHSYIMRLPQGNHEELMAKKGFYYQLYASQFE